MFAGVEVWVESVGTCLVAAGAQDTKAMQGKMGGVARSRYSQDRMVEGGG